ncbi:MAG: hypothetical protein HUU15_10755, partial [Candidatus Brocadiae bacterium]|nr:hypothetical protein [Candidatus Brocadiia bacterium]
ALPAAAAADGGPGSLQPVAPPSPYEMDDLARRLKAVGDKLEARIEKENRDLAEARGHVEGIRARTSESLAILEKESAAIKDELAGKAADETKVADLTKRIRTEQQKALIKRFVAAEMEKENAKLKADLGLTPEQAAAYDQVAAEMMDKFADVGSSFMDGEANPLKFAELVQENNTKMSAVLSPDQMKQYTDYQQKRWGNRGGGGGGGGGEGAK